MRMKKKFSRGFTDAKQGVLGEKFFMSINSVITARDGRSADTINRPDVRDAVDEHRRRAGGCVSSNLRPTMHCVRLC